jgi:hypothetical protein
MVGRPGAVGLGHRDGLVVEGPRPDGRLANLGNTLQKRIPERLLRWTAAGVLPSGSRPDDLFGSTLPSVGPAAPVASCGCRAGGPPEAARRAGLEDVEKLLTNIINSVPASRGGHRVQDARSRHDPVASSLEAAEHRGGIVVALASRPPPSLRVRLLRVSHLLDQRCRPAALEDVEQAGPIQQAEPVGQPGRTIGHHGRAVQLATIDGAAKRLLGSLGVGACHPVAVVAVAPALQLGHQLRVPLVMDGRAGWLLVHGGVFDGGELGQPVVGDDRDAGGQVEDDDGVGEHEVVHELPALSEDRDRC